MSLQPTERQFVERQRRFYQQQAAKTDPAVSLAGRLCAVLIVLVGCCVVGLWVGQHSGLPDEPMGLLGLAVGVGILWRTRAVIRGRQNRQ